MKPTEQEPQATERSPLIEEVQQIASRLRERLQGQDTGPKEAES